jgi:hypothetical protein
MFTLSILAIFLRAKGLGAESGLAEPVIKDDDLRETRQGARSAERAVWKSKLDRFMQP